MITKINELILSVRARFHKEEGQGLVEYGLILALISVVAIAALTATGVGVNAILEQVSGVLGGGS
ncbi:MAG TPA: Flp family type IVb pilin [Dehalococcoidia bacterium]|nr:Flp family type IVb pilin [Dehalococcoidia bacterium]